MTTTYSVNSSGSFMNAMQTMNDACVQLKMEDITQMVPAIDNELNKDIKSAGKCKLAVLSQDRNEWDDIFDEFIDPNFDINFLISDKNKSSTKAVYKRLWRLINSASFSVS